MNDSRTHSSIRPFISLHNERSELSGVPIPAACLSIYLMYYLRWQVTRLSVFHRVHSRDRPVDGRWGASNYRENFSEPFLLPVAVYMFQQGGSDESSV